MGHYLKKSDISVFLSSGSVIFTVTLTNYHYMKSVRIRGYWKQEYDSNTNKNSFHRKYPYWRVNVL